MTTVQAGAHPCFDPAARLRAARVHLPVAPRCNVQCNYCDRTSDCASESRPGVSSTVLTPTQALTYLEDVVRQVPDLAVVGIAGPGDPFANGAQTLHTLRLCRDRHPELMLCLATNGLRLPEHLDEIADLGVSHVTITVNTVDPLIGARIYRWVRDRTTVHRGIAGAQLLLDRQLAGIQGLKERGITVKINTILIPGITIEGAEEVARTVGELGADAMNCVPMYPVEGTPFAGRGTPDALEVAAARAGAGLHLTQLSHCQRCRADAVGQIDEQHTPATLARLADVCRPSVDGRPYVAAASREGYLINLHLGAAEQFAVYAHTPHGSRLVEIRPAPQPGGAGRWTALTDLLSDCRALLVNQLGEAPGAVLTAAGIAVHETDGLIADAADAVFAGRRPPRVSPENLTGACTGHGVGCG